jgi:hypothetical protein
MNDMPNPLKVIGRRDRIDLPGLGYWNIKAKVDTGAYGSALHCSQMKVVCRDGKNCLSFMLLDPEHPEFREQVHFAEHFTEKLVKNSSGEGEQRYIIKTEVVIFGKTISTEFSLTDRRDMKYPILLGRKFLRKRFIVDVRLKDVSYKLKKKNQK